jgi:hypothetical protein
MSGETVSVDVSELTSALSKEVTALRNELALIRNDREQELRSVSTHTHMHTRPGTNATAMLIVLPFH